MNIKKKILKKSIYSLNDIPKWYYFLSYHKKNMFLDKQIKKELKRNIDLKNKYSDKRCFILGNASSLNLENLFFLKNEYVFTVNSFHRVPNFEKIDTNFHFFIDHDFFNGEFDNEVLLFTRNFLPYKKKPVLFFIDFARHYVEKNNLKKDFDIRYIANGRSYALADKYDFALHKLTVSFYTVVQYCIMAALYMGFKEIYLLGADCNQFKYISLKNGEYFLKNSHCFTSECASDIPYKISIYLRVIASIFEGYEFLKRLEKDFNAKIFNCSSKSLISDFPFVNIEKFMKESGCSK